MHYEDHWTFGVEFRISYSLIIYLIWNFKVPFDMKDAWLEQRREAYPDAGNNPLVKIKLRYAEMRNEVLPTMLKACVTDGEEKLAGTRGFQLLRETKCFRPD
jgi:hypothetical protein